VIAKNSTLQYLDVTYNVIGKAGLDALAKSSIPEIQDSGNADQIKLSKSNLKNWARAHCMAQKDGLFCRRFFQI